MVPAGYIAVEFEQILQRSEKALRIQFMDGQTEWVPLTQIHNPEKFRLMDHDGMIFLTKWIAERLRL